MVDVMTAIALVGGLAGLIFAIYLVFSIMRLPEGSAKMKEIAEAIRQGAAAYLNRQYRTLAIFVIALTVLIGFFIDIATSITFAVGAVLSALAGYIGMNTSVRANVRTAQAATKGLRHAFRTAFMGGSVTGFAVVGLGLVGVTLLFMWYEDPKLLIGFGFGASLISLFARVGGGIYTKGADVGADLVGKVEKGIPEDDPRNPAVIADQVGDNVGDCAGMAADLFESYTVTLIATMLLGIALGPEYVLFPLAIAGVGIVGSIVSTLFVSTANKNKVWSVLNRGIMISALLSAIGFYFVTTKLFDSIDLFLASLVGLFVTIAIGWITEYYTATNRKPVQQIAESAKTGPATVIISGISKGFQSTFVPLLVIVAGILISYHFGGVYGIAVAAMAMLSMSGIIVAVDTFGPITDNAGGIAEMAEMPSKVRGITDPLDAVGNTTKAVTKGFAIGSAALAALSLFVAYSEEIGLVTINLLDARVVAGLFIGGMLPFIFSAMTMNAVSKAAFAMVEEVRRQFKDIKGIMEGKAKPDYSRCVDISTKSAIRELFLPGILAVFSPVIVGFVLGAEALGGLLAGSIVTGLLLAITMTNSGGAWDNAKKFIEDGNLGGKGSEAHKAAVVGDTVGDPFKDTSGPAINPLIKVLNTVAILIATMIVSSPFLI